MTLAGDFCGTLDSVFFEPANITIEELNLRCKNTLNTSLGIEFTEIGRDYLVATMPVDHRTVQPMGVLNGGASLGLIETLGSMASNLTLDNTKFIAVGQAVQCHHFRPAFAGSSVKGKTMLLHLGKRSQVWEVTITGVDYELICKGSITLAIVPSERLRA
jgi:1,4-dihydroxy-2-naphthoyl-CoA hydrolase